MKVTSIRAASQSERAFAKARELHIKRNAMLLAVVNNALLKVINGKQVGIYEWDCKINILPHIWLRVCVRVCTHKYTNYPLLACRSAQR